MDLNKIKNDNSTEKAAILSGKGNTEILRWKSAERTIKISAEEQLTLRIKTFNFSGWKAYLDGNQAKIKKEDGSGAMLINMPKGEYMLELRFKGTPIRYYSKVISLVSFFSIALLTLFMNRRFIC